jgi:hypothetical protein
VLGTLSLALMVQKMLQVIWQCLILGVLSYLGHGWTFRDLWENTRVHAEVPHQFFHVFIAYASNV